MKKQTTITEIFIAVAISENTNSFGLHQAVLIAKDGTTFKACASYLSIPKRGDKVKVPLTLTEVDGDIKKDYNFAEAGFEIPEKIDSPPSEVLAEIWN